MSRVIFPPFQHKSGSTELEHALDARKLDEAFSELAGVLNGGVDESNLSAGVKFSTVAPGGVNVGTAIAVKYSLVTLRAVYLAGRGAAGGGMSSGHTFGSGWIMVGATLMGHSTAVDNVATFGVASGGVSLGSNSIQWEKDSTGYSFSSDWSESGPVSVAISNYGVVVASFPSSPAPDWAVAELTFKVPVL